MYISPLFCLSLVWVFSVVALELVHDLYAVPLGQRLAFYVILLSIFLFIFPIATLIKWRKDAAQTVGILPSKYRMIFLGFLLITLLEIIVSGNLPLFYLFGFGTSVSYTEYGIGGLHGLVNGAHLALLCGSVILFLNTRKKIYFLLAFLLFLWCIVLVSRQLLLSATVTSAFTYIGYRTGFKIGKLGIFYASLVAFLVLFLFAFIGDVRTGGVELFPLLGYEPRFEFLNWSISQWVVTYLSSPLVNMLNNIGYDNSIFSVLSPLFPSMIRDHFFQIESPSLVIPIFNVSSALFLYTSSVGYFGVLIYFFIFGFLEISIRRVRSFRMRFAGRVFLYHAAFFSFFADFLVSLPFAAMAFFLFKMLRAVTHVKDI